MRHAALRHACLAVVCLTMLSGAQAQSWPDKPIRLVVPFAPGGVTDIAARAVAQTLSQGLKQPVIVENKTGAQGMVGTQAVKAAAPDGYTLVVMSSSVVCVTPYLRKDVTIDALKDFEPIGIIGSAPLVMVVSPKTPAETVDQFVSYVKANPGKISYSSPGVGGSGNLYGAVMNATSRLDMQHVPFQGGAPAIQAVMSGEIAMTFSDVGSATGPIAGARVRPLAVAGEKRWPRFPSVPTFAEIGYPINLVGWVGLAAPANTPRAIVDRLSAELGRFAANESHRETLINAGAMMSMSNPEHMRAAIRDGCPRWGEAVKSAGIQPQ